MSKSLGTVHAVVAICLSIVQIDAACGHCEDGQNYIYWACDLHHAPPCSTGEKCLWETLPPGIYINARCVHTYVDANNCVVAYWEGTTTSRWGVCTPDCSCILYGDPWEDHGGGNMCYTPDSCT